LQREYEYDLFRIMRRQGNEDSYCDTYGGGLLPPEVFGTPACAEGGNGEWGADENVWNCPDDCATEADRKNCVIFPENYEIPPAELKPQLPSKEPFNHN
jgi:hypothetical protein